MRKLKVGKFVRLFVTIYVSLYGQEIWGKTKRTFGNKYSDRKEFLEAIEILVEEYDDYKKKLSANTYDNKNPTANFIRNTRNKISFHADGEFLRIGFLDAFASEQKKYGKPAVSFGATAMTARFYFADAAAQEALEKLGRKEFGDEVVEKTHELIEQMSMVIRTLSECYLTCRGIVYVKG